MISTSCLAIREYIGPAFAYSSAKKFIKLRSDFSKEEKNDCKKQCEDVLNNYNGPKNEDSSYFILLSKKIKKNDKDKILKKSLKIKFGNAIIEKDEEDKDSKSSSDSDIEEDKKITDKINVKELNLDDLLKDYEEEIEQEEDKDLYEKKEEEEEQVNNNVIYIEFDEDEEGEIIDDLEENIKIDYEGFFFKKSNNSYRKYYFQVKNGCLYWFVDKNTNMAKNKISLKHVNKIDSSEEKKFVLKLNEKGEINEYKFKCNSEEEKIKWVKAITRAMKKVQKENEIQIKEKIEVKQRKKIINDFFNLPNIKNDGVYIEEKVMGSLAGEDFFKMTPEKIERIRKENKKKIEEEKKLKKLEKEKIKKIRKR